MKKYLYILSIAALGLSSCSGDYLDTTPGAQMDKANVLGSTEKAEMAINGLCKAMSSQYMGTQGFNGEGTILNWYGTFTGNDAQKSNQTSWAGVWNSTYHLRPTVTYLA